jgi:hypothetical protein
MTMMTSDLPGASFEYEEVKVDLRCEVTAWGVSTATIHFRDPTGYGMMRLTPGGAFFPNSTIKWEWLYALAEATKDVDFGTALNRARSYIEANWGAPK